MSEVSLSIGGRSYKVACADGEEAHVRRLGAAIETKLQSMPQLSGQDSQNLLFCALLLADELHDLRNAQTTAQDEAEEARAALLPFRQEVDRLKAEAQGTRAQMLELAGAAEAAGRHEAAVRALRGELEELRQAEADMGRELQAAQSAEAELRSQLETLTAELGDLREQLEAAHAAARPSPLDDPGLAPALEQFASLLETCADKLERGAPST